MVGPPAVIVGVVGIAPTVAVPAGPVQLLAVCVADKVPDARVTPVMDHAPALTVPEPVPAPVRLMVAPVVPVPVTVVPDPEQ